MLSMTVVVFLVLARAATSTACARTPRTWTARGTRCSAPRSPRSSQGWRWSRPSWRRTSSTSLQPPWTSGVGTWSATTRRSRRRRCAGYLSGRSTACNARLLRGHGGVGMGGSLVTVAALVFAAVELFLLFALLVLGLRCGCGRLAGLPAPCPTGASPRLARPPRACRLPGRSPAAAGAASQRAPASLSLIERVFRLPPCPPRSPRGPAGGKGTSSMRSRARPGSLPATSSEAA
mmetsp:Transcript_1650/g.4185  ORF Transcript_1650/g.4185 Transcript_1650/m.4185 type:complete len:234 (-) Transcript_1650:759-1460(-)